MSQGKRRHVFSGRSRRAFLLQEAVLWIAGLTAATLFATPLLFGVIRMKLASERASHQLVLLKNLADGFRRDVNASRIAPERIRIDGEEFVASDKCLILQRPDQGEVVYRWNKNTLERIENANFETNIWKVPVDPEVISLQFLQAREGPKLISLKMVLQRDPVQPRRPFEIQALLGGDL